MRMIGQKNVNSVKTTLYMGQKSQQNALFFPISHEKITGSCHFFQVFYENPLLSSPYMVKKTSNLSKLHYFGPEKTIGCPSFLIFHGKITALISTAHIFSKNRPFSKNHLFLCPYYVKKTSILTKTNCSHIIFIKIFIKNSLRSYLYLVKKTSILSKLHIMTKKVNRMSFFSDISRKKFALMPIYFQKKTSIL